MRGVKSGLLGLLTGLHKPELDGMRGKYTKWMMVSEMGPSPSFPRRAASIEDSYGRGDLQSGCCRRRKKCPPNPGNLNFSTEEEWATYLSEPSLSTGMCEMPRLLEKSDLFEEILAKPFPPATRTLHQCRQS